MRRLVIFVGGLALIQLVAFLLLPGANAWILGGALLASNLLGVLEGSTR